MTNGGNGLLGVSRINYFSSLMVLTGKYHCGRSANALKCFISEGWAQKWSSISTLPNISLKDMIFIIMGNYLLFAIIKFQKHTVSERTRSNFNIHFNISV